MTPPNDSISPPPRRGPLGWLWRLAVVGLVPPLVTLAVVGLGTAVDRIPTDHAQYRFAVTLLLLGPVAPAAGFAVAVETNGVLLRGTRFGRRPVYAMNAVSLVVAFVVWGWAFRHFVGPGWG